jgi:hypothetical protein
VNEASIKVTGVEHENWVDFSIIYRPSKKQKGYQQVFENGLLLIIP